MTESKFITQFPSREQERLPGNTISMGIGAKSVLVRNIRFIGQFAWLVLNFSNVNSTRDETSLINGLGYEADSVITPFKLQSNDIAERD